MSWDNEIRKRRTFAIISHPDAGKTTITEKILYHGRVIQEAGEVKGKSGSKAATSDWMKLEQQRGVSITSSVMQFDYEGLRVNLLDTPGHKDFSEDTYRTLTAADCAAMLIDAAKGVEAQTRKLYEVCRLRKMPIFTFANKMDREGKSPLDLIDDVENTLRMECFPVTWPIGMGDRFRGLYHRLEKSLYLYNKDSEIPTILPLDRIEEANIDEEVLEEFQDELELLDGLIGELDVEAFLSGKVSPLTFGSAKYNWGVDVFLKLFTEHAPPPQPRPTKSGEIVNPSDNYFSGFVFKIQANMDKNHRDRSAFIRICSGKFERGMKVAHQRLGRDVRLAYANQFIAQERETVDIAYAGDIVGINDTGNFQIADTVTSGPKLEFSGIPRFAPEHFGRMVTTDAMKRKQLEKGLRQLVDEGSIQMFCDPNIGWQDPILGVVGVLQFEVLIFRLEDEYKIDAKLETLSFTSARWPFGQDGKQLKKLDGNVKVYHDINENSVILLQGDWDLNWAIKHNPDAEFRINSGE